LMVRRAHSVIWKLMCGRTRKRRYLKGTGASYSRSLMVVADKGDTV
jgi:hypothetical protein